jgi:polyhydroxybutyrate depolymerase
MMHRRTALIVMIALISLPIAVVAIEAARYFVSNRSTHTIASSGVTREYVLYVPPTYVPGRPTPLVISMHGAVLWGAAHREISQFDRLAAREGFIVVYPTGVTGEGPIHWEATRHSQPSRDVAFIRDLIDALGRTYDIDPARIYANGLSNGGGMSFVLSCRMSDRIAAVGLVASAQLLPWSACADDRPVPMINFHGTADWDTPYAGGKSAKSWISPQTLPSAPEWTANWARRNRCAPTPIESRVTTDVTKTEYTECAGNATAVLYTIEGGGHTWPGGGDIPEWFVGTSTNSIDASSVMWEFFKAHPLAK